MSNFKDLYKEKCFVVEEYTRPIGCPTCIPDLSEPIIDWLQTDEPYFDPRTCEYVINYLAPHRVEDLTILGDTLTSYVEWVKVYGATKIFKHFAKKLPSTYPVSSNNLNWTTEPFTAFYDPTQFIESGDYYYIQTSPENVIVETYSFIRIRVSLPAVYFDNIEDIYNDPNEATPPTDVASNLPTEVLISDENSEFNLDYEAVLIGMRAYQVKHEFFMLSDGAIVRKVPDNPKEFIPFKFNKFIDNIKNFKKRLNKFLNLNGFKILDLFNLFSFDRQVISVRIELDNSGDPMMISKVFVTPPDCPEIEITKGLPNFIRDCVPYKPAIFFFSNFQDIHSEVVSANPPKDWLEFLDEYVYPPVFVDYGDNPENSEIVQGPGGCALSIDFDSILRNLLNDLSVGLWDSLVIEVDKDSCNQDEKKSNPTYKMQFNNKIEREHFNKLYKEEVAKLKAERNKIENSTNIPPPRMEGESELQYREKVRQAEENKQAQLAVLDKKAMDAAKKNFDERPHAQRNKEETNVLDQAWKDAIKGKYDSENSLFETLGDMLGTDDPLDELTKIQNYINAIGLCGITKGMKKALSCFLKQVSYEDAIKAAIKAGFDLMPPGVIEEAFAGLPLEKQNKIFKKIQDDFGADFEKVPWPWEIAGKETNGIKKAQQRMATEKARKGTWMESYKAAMAAGDQEAIEAYNSRYKEIEEEYNKEKLLGIPNEVQTSVDKIAGDNDISIGFGTVPLAQKYSIGEYTLEVMFDEQKEREDFAQASVIQQKQSDISKKLNEIGKELLNAYIEAMFEFLGIDDLLKMYDQYPTIKLILDMLKSFIKCPTGFQEDFYEDFWKSFDLDICDPTLPVVNFNIPKLELFNPMQIISIKFKEVLSTVIQRILAKIIKMFLDWLEDTLCSLADLAGAFLLRPDKAFGDFANLLEEAFCPEADDETAKQAANDILNAVGAQDGEFERAIDCIGSALAGMFSREELISLMIDENPSESLVRRVANCILISCPRFADILGTPESARACFGNIRDLIPEDMRDRLQDMRNFIPSQNREPAFSTICLTNEELESWDNFRRGALEENNLTPEEAQQQIDNYTERGRRALEDLLRDLANTPDGDGIADLLKDAINDALQANSPLASGCDLPEGESNYGSKAISEPKDLVRIQDELSNRIMDVIGDSFSREYASKKGVGGPSMFERIMRDTNGENYSYHSFLTDFFLTELNYHDSLGSKARKDALSPLDKFIFGIFNSDDEDKNIGYFPETVGNSLQETLLEDIEYSTAQQENYSLIFNPEIEALSAKYERLESGGSYGAVKYYSDVESGNVFDYRIEVETSLPEPVTFVHNEKPPVEPDVSDLVQSLNLPQNSTKSSLFSILMNQRLAALDASVSFDDVGLFDAMGEKIFGSARKITVSGSDGFYFGYEEEDLTEQDLNYVDPEEGSTEYTYSESEKVLGRSQTNHPRVYFLDPEIHGGTYKLPHVYIEPKVLRGWRYLQKILAPIEEPCEPKTENIISFSQLKKHVNNTRNSMNHDSRLKAAVNDCFVEKPYDKILSKNAASVVDGICRMHIRMAISNLLTTGMPALMNVEYNQENYNNLLAEIVYSTLINDLYSVNPLGPRKIEFYNYAMLVVEQIVQSYEREVILKLPEGDVNGRDISTLSQTVQDAYVNINEIREEYTYEKNTLPREGQTLTFLSTDTDRLDNRLHYAYSRWYKEKGEAIFESGESFVFGAPPSVPLSNPPTPFLPPWDDWKLHSKILAIRLSLNSAKVLVKEVIKIEIEKMMKEIGPKLNTKIKDLHLNILTDKDLFFSNELKGLGTTEYNNRKSSGANLDIGDVNHVLETVAEQTPWQDADEKFYFKLEKYIRIFDKQSYEELGEIDLSLITERDPAVLKGVCNLESAQEFFDLLKQEDHLKDLYISDLFGNAALSEDNPEEYLGTIGLRYGIRIVMKMPDESMGGVVFSSDTLSEQDRVLSDNEKAYFCNYSNQDFANANYFSLPICGYELELKDVMIKDVDFTNGENVYDLDCMLNGLVREPFYKMLFKYLVPIRASSSMTQVFCSLFLIPSIGINDGWAENMYAKKFGFFDGSDIEAAAVFKETNLVCRKYFASFYESTKFVNSENWRMPKIEVPDLFGLLFGGFQIPGLNLKLQFPDFQFKHRIIKDSPFNKNKEECEE